MHGRMKTLATLTILSAFVFACGGGGGETPPPVNPSNPATDASSSGGAASGKGGEPQTVDEQIAAGQKLYGEHCASCHGAGGEGGGKSPRVVGLDKGALPLDPPPSAKMRKVQFKTAADVGDWAAKNMPPGEGGSLKEWQYWAIIAFDLKANGATPSKKVDASSAKEIVLHK